MHYQMIGIPAIHVIQHYNIQFPITTLSTNLIQEELIASQGRNNLCRRYGFNMLNADVQRRINIQRHKLHYMLGHTPIQVVSANQVEDIFVFQSAISKSRHIRIRVFYMDSLLLYSSSD